MTATVTSAPIANHTFKIFNQTKIAIIKMNKNIFTAIGIFLPVLSAV